MKNWEKNLISVMSGSHVDNVQSNTLKFVKETLNEIITEIGKEKSALICDNHIKVVTDKLKEKYL